MLVFEVRRRCPRWRRCWRGVGGTRSVTTEAEATSVEGGASQAIAGGTCWRGSRGGHRPGGGNGERMTKVRLVRVRVWVLFCKYWAYLSQCVRCAPREAGCARDLSAHVLVRKRRNRLRTFFEPFFYCAWIIHPCPYRYLRNFQSFSRRLCLEHFEDCFPNIGIARQPAQWKLRARHVPCRSKIGGGGSLRDDASPSQCVTLPAVDDFLLVFAPCPTTL